MLRKPSKVNRIRWKFRLKLVCPICDKIFFRKLKSKWKNRFCSCKCMGLSYRRNRASTRCNVCNKIFYHSPTQRARKTCSKSCRIKRLIEKGALSGGKHGKFYSRKNQCFIHYDSSWELSLFEKLEDDIKVKQYVRCPYVIPYKYKNKIRRYFPDVLVEYIDDTKAIIEVKPKFMLAFRKNKAKIMAARLYCSKNNLQFGILQSKKQGKII